MTEQIVSHLNAGPDTCQCCGNEPSVGVASIPGVPMSIAWGRKCLEAGVVPYDILVANSALGSSGPVIERRPHWAEWWEEIIAVTLPYFGKTEEEFIAAVNAQNEEFDQMERRDAEAQRDRVPGLHNEHDGDSGSDGGDGDRDPDDRPHDT